MPTEDTYAPCPISKQYFHQIVQKVLGAYESIILHILSRPIDFLARILILIKIGGH